MRYENSRRILERYFSEKHLCNNTTPWGEGMMPRWLIEIEHTLNIWNQRRMSNYFYQVKLFSIVGIQCRGSSVITSYGELLPRSARGWLNQSCINWLIVILFKLSASQASSFDSSCIFRSADTWNTYSLLSPADWVFIISSMSSTSLETHDILARRRNSSIVNAISSFVKVIVSIIMQR